MCQHWSNWVPKTNKYERDGLRYYNERAKHVILISRQNLGNTESRGIAVMWVKAPTAIENFVVPSSPVLL